MIVVFYYRFFQLFAAKRTLYIKVKFEYVIHRIIYSDCHLAELCSFPVGWQSWRVSEGVWRESCHHLGTEKYRLRCNIPIRRNLRVRARWCPCLLQLLDSVLKCIDFLLITNSLKLSSKISNLFIYWINVGISKKDKVFFGNLGRASSLLWNNYVVIATYNYVIVTLMDSIIITFCSLDGGRAVCN